LITENTMGAVLLYYKYVNLSEQRQDIAAWMLSSCTELDLKGRVRVANDGINVTVRSSHNRQRLSEQLNSLSH
jgi:predicted sulfurtransferase